MPSNPLLINDFSLVRNDRVILKSNNKYFRGGGLAFYVHNSIDFKVLDESNNLCINDIEYILFEININNQKFLFCLIYRRPGGTFFYQFSKILHDYINKYDEIILLGDLNCDYCVNRSDTLQLKLFLNEFSLQVIPTGPSFKYKNNKKSWLDFVITNSSNLIKSYTNTSTPFHLQHDMISCTLELKKKSSSVSCFYKLSQLEKL